MVNSIINMIPDAIKINLAYKKLSSNLDVQPIISKENEVITFN